VPTNGATTPARPPGRPRSGIHAEVFAATLRTVHELGYARATVDRIAAAAGVAKTTVYRRWPSKGALITDCLLDVFGPLPGRGSGRDEDVPAPIRWITAWSGERGTDPSPLRGTGRDEAISSTIRWVAAKIGEPGVGDAFAGVFSDAVSDPALREILRARLQDPFRDMFQRALGESEARVLLLIDVVVGTLLHRMGMIGEPMADSDLDALVEMVVAHFAD
jgi:AcrR family transcriptional regulator